MSIKARFYRGPWNGRVKYVRDDESVVLVNTAKVDKPVFFHLDQNSPILPMTYDVHRYYRTRHTHPDGSVFFEWDRPKGSRK